ncbi:SMN family protein Smn1 [Immersiella caudata]|uniref:SMN family protein Smn1 n=1 Tax=Immersiella caudata TaxID=314043 RepID=A0AA39WE89_9PEZI|nr:SMN family protein Smn1 [Immersiella caudata]
MDDENNLTHEEIWDDSALVNSWNQALDEYKKYHSIHAAGGTVEDIIESDHRAAARRDAKPETEPAGGPMDEGDATPRSRSDETRPEATEKVRVRSGSIPAVGPQVLLGSVQDEDLKKLLMSWYYAGYYTGLFEGKQQAQSELASGSKSSHR